MNNTFDKLKQEFNQFLIDNNLEQDTSIISAEEWKARGENIGKDSFATIVTEGMFNHIINMYSGLDEFKKLDLTLVKMFKKYGLYYEFGYSWTLHLYHLR